MVKAAREAPGTGAIRPLRVPKEIKVQVDSEGYPRAVMGRRVLHVSQVEDVWRLDDEWWREEPVFRMYYRVLLEDGRHFTLFHDLVKNRWHEQDYA